MATRRTRTCAQCSTASYASCATRRPARCSSPATAAARACSASRTTTRRPSTTRSPARRPRASSARARSAPSATATFCTASPPRWPCSRELRVQALERQQEAGMYSWIVGQALRRLEKQLTGGEVDKLMAAYADNAVMVFPGDNTWSGEYRGKVAIRTWVERFVALKPTFEVGDAAVAGPPWNMRIFFRFTDRIVAPDGFEYRNAGMEYVRMRFGKIVEHRVHLDTEKVTELDAHLAQAAAACPTAGATRRRTPGALADAR